MSQFGRGYDINQTFVVESQNNDLPILSACTVVYTNFIQSCSGDTQIFLGTGVVSINGNLETNTISATTYYGDGSNLTGISTQDTFVTGGTYNSGIATFTNNTGGTFSISGFSTGYTLTESEIISALGYIPLSAYTDVFVTGGTYNNGTATFTNNTGGTFSISGFSSGGGGEFTGGTVSGPTIFTNGLSANTFSATTYLGLPTDVFVTGGTYDNGTATFTNNTGGTFNVSGFLTGQTDIFVSGLTFINNLLTIKQTNNQDDISVLINELTGLTVNGSISATTYLNLPIDVFVTGGTYDNGTATFTNNTGGTFTVTGFNSGGGVFTGGTVNGPTNFTDGLSANTFSATTYLGLPLDVFVTGGTYNSSLSAITFINNTGGTFTVTGITSGDTGIDTFVTGFTYNNDNQFTIKQNQGQPDLNVSINTVTGLTTDYFDFNTGATVTPAVSRLRWNDSDGTLDIGLKGGNVTLQIGQEEVVRVVNKTGSNLLESNYQVVRVRTAAEGGAQGQRLAVLLAQANTKANHSSVLGLVTENIDNNQEGFITTFGKVRGINTTGSLQGETWVDGDVLWLSETVAGRLTNIEPQNHPVQIGYVVYAHPTQGKIFVKIDESVNELSELHDVNVTGATDGQVLTYSAASQTWVPTTITSGSVFTGGTVTGPTIFTGGLSATTFSATTYLGLPTDIRVTGGTYTNGTATFTNNTGGTFSVSGFSTGGGNSIGQLTGDVTGGPATASSQSVAATVKQNLKTGAFGITIDGLGGVISSGQKGYVYVPYDGIITGWSIFSDVVGSCVVDVWKDTYGNFPPTSGDSIAGTQKPTLTSQTSNRDLTLSSWTTTISSGDVIGFNVEPSPTGVTRVNLIINVIKT